MQIFTALGIDFELVLLPSTVVVVPPVVAPIVRPVVVLVVDIPLVVVVVYFLWRQLFQFGHKSFLFTFVCLNLRNANRDGNKICPVPLLSLSVSLCETLVCRSCPSSPGNRRNATPQRQPSLFTLATSTPKRRHMFPEPRRTSEYVNLLRSQRQNVNGATPPPPPLDC